MPPTDPVPDVPVPDFGADARAARIYARFAEAGQAHVFAFWNRLETDQRHALIEQLESINLDRVHRLATLIVDSGGEDAQQRPVYEPPGIIERPRTDDEKQAWEEAREEGQTMLAAGRIAALTVAGGQASRLGLDIPKGCLPFGPVTGMTLFEVFARQIAAVEEVYGKPMPWMIMTSQANHMETVAFFEQHDHFGLDPNRVRFFPQAMLPALDDRGRLLLAAPDRVFTAPDGHGGVLGALRRHTLLGWLAGQRCDTVSYFQVDNPQVRLADPVFIGLHTMSGCEFSTQVVRKEDESERVGLVVRRPDGKLTVAEYSDMPADQQARRDPDGRLTFRAGNAAIHLIDVPFIVRITNPRQGGVAADGLPMHVARKKVPHVDLASATGHQEVRVVEPESANAYKFEQFIFDAMPEAARGAVVEVDRAAGFLPVKSAEGPTSPDAVKREYQRYWAGVLRDLGCDVPVNADGVPTHRLEVHPRYLLDGDDHALLAERVKTSPPDVSGDLFVE